MEAQRIFIKKLLSLLIRASGTYARSKKAVANEQIPELVDGRKFQMAIIKKDLQDIQELVDSFFQYLNQGEKDKKAESDRQEQMQSEIDAGVQDGMDREKRARDDAFGFAKMFNPLLTEMSKDGESTKAKKSKVPGEDVDAGALENWTADDPRRLLEKMDTGGDVNPFLELLKGLDDEKMKLLLEAANELKGDGNDSEKTNKGE